MLKDLAAHAWPARRASHDHLLVFVVYALVAYLAIVTARQPGSIATIWPANGAAIALIASAPRARRWGLLAAAAAGNLLANLAYGDTLAVALAFLPANSLEVALGVALVDRTGRAERFANDHESFFRVLAAGAFGPPLLGATLGAGTLQLLGFASFSRVWADWYIGGALGGAAFLPLVLALRTASFDALLSRFLAPATLVALATVVATSALALVYIPYPFVTISVVLTVFAVIRPRLVTFTNAALVVAVLAVALALRWYVPLGPNTPLGHVLVFAAGLLVIVPAQVLSVVVARQRALSEMLAAVGSRVDDIIVFVDMAGVYRWVNQARALYWGVPNDRALGRTLADNVGAPAYESIFKPLFEAALAGQVARRTVDFDYPVRGERTMDLQMQPALDEEGHQIGVLLSGTDVTELEASRRELQKAADRLLAANRNLEQFVRISSHDLREPLNSIIQFCDLIDEHAAGQLDERGRLYFHQVRSSGARMKVMLDDVLQLVRLDAGVRIERTPVDLDRLLEDVQASLAARIQSSGAELRVGRLGVVAGQASLLTLVFQNLLSNALKFVPPDCAPRVEVSATRQAGEVRISVTDNGIGIDPARIGDLGTPFRRLHARRKYEGTGLGLTICKRIAQQLGGRIDIESTPGVGSCFSLVLADADVRPAPGP